MTIKLNTFPKYYSFINFRPERFGALVFNPYTASELELNRNETYIGAFFSGEFSVNDIITSYGNSFFLPVFEARKQVFQVIEKIKGIGALKLHETKQVPTVIEKHREQIELTSGPYYTAPKGAVWDITYLCNLKCPHCLTSSGNKKNDELSHEEAIRLIDRLAEAKLLYLSFSGGEPFLRPDLPELINYSSKKNIRTDIASNGVDIDSSLLLKLRDLPLFHIQVSIDGIGNSHDTFRGRTGAFNKIIENIKRLKNEGISVSVSTTATATNYNQIGSIIDLAAEMGCIAYKAIPFLPAGRGRSNTHLILGSEDYLNVCKTLREKSKEYSGIINISSETTFAFLLGHHVTVKTEDGYMGCSAGYDTLSIGANGTAYPCPFLQEIPLGNLLEIPLRDLWKNSPILAELRGIYKKDMDQPCRECSYAPEHCRGGCRASAFYKTGSLRGCDPMCPLSRSSV